MDELITKHQLANLKSFLGHFNRKNSYRIICLLYKHPDGLTATEIMDKLGVAQSETTSTLRMLYLRGFAKTTREGKFIRYQPRYFLFKQLIAFYNLIYKPKQHEHKG